MSAHLQPAPRGHQALAAPCLAAEVLSDYQLCKSSLYYPCSQHWVFTASQQHDETPTVCQVMSLSGLFEV